MQKQPLLCVLVASSLLLVSSCLQRGRGAVKAEGAGVAETLPAQSWEALGTVCTVNAFDDGDESLYGAISTRLMEVDAAFGVNRTCSDIARVNASAGKDRVAVRPDVFLVIKTALGFAERSGGAFDPTIGPLVSLWGIGTEHQKVPSQAEIDAALALVDWRKVVLDESGSSVFLEKEGMSLDLGGIAKGYAADEVVRILKEKEVKRAVIDLGGNVYVCGNKADGSAWRVGVKNPLDGGTSVAAVLSLSGGLSVVTSGNYERYFVSGGRRYHHIIDPKTGYPGGSNVASATIVAASSMEADAMSTSAFLMGKDAFTRAFPDIQCVFIYADGSIAPSGNVSVQQP
ncbi:MAG: FAD:protein FMN transferase [Treponema sp.]|nr:FAD:protein FMN transferase [Treponema sp.]